MMISRGNDILETAEAIYGANAVSLPWDKADPNDKRDALDAAERAIARLEALGIVRFR